MTITKTLDVGAYFSGLDHLGITRQLLAEAGVQAATSNPGSTSVTVRIDEGVTGVDEIEIGRSPWLEAPGEDGFIETAAALDIVGVDGEGGNVVRHV